MQVLLACFIFFLDLGSLTLSATGPLIDAAATKGAAPLPATELPGAKLRSLSGPQQQGHGPWPWPRVEQELPMPGRTNRTIIQSMGGESGLKCVSLPLPLWLCVVNCLHQPVLSTEPL